MVKNFSLRGNALFGYRLITIKDSGRNFIKFSPINKPQKSFIISDTIVKKNRKENYLPRKEADKLLKKERKLIKKKVCCSNR